MKQSGFTLIELVIVVIILGILSATAIPKFMDLQSDARISVLDGIKGEVKSLNNQIYAMQGLDYIVQRSNDTNESHTFFDANKDGIQDTSDDSDEWNLIYYYLDNTDVIKAITFSSDLTEEESNNMYEYYIGYDLDGDESVSDDNCYFLYYQATAADDEPEYSIESSGC